MIVQQIGRKIMSVSYVERDQASAEALAFYDKADDVSPDFPPA